MQKSLSELTSLSSEELTVLMDQVNEPLLVTCDGQPRFVAQSLAGFEAMIRRLRALERENRTSAPTTFAEKPTSRPGGKVIPFPR
jgi:PHD/YefM family antitoxin component YafN of YafNO toxin-antitoxin module